MLQPHQRLHRIADVAETPGLRAFTENFQRFAFFRRSDEPGQHHAVAPGLARADGVEQPRDDDRQRFFPRIGQRQEFVGKLRARIAPT